MTTFSPFAPAPDLSAQHAAFVKLQNELHELFHPVPVAAAQVGDWIEVDGSCHIVVVCNEYVVEFDERMLPPNGAYLRRKQIARRD